jgi:ABC-2 type transport system permease protein
MIIATFMQYRLNMLFVFIGQLITTLSVFFGIYLLFERFGTLEGWSFAEVALCFGVAVSGFAIAECFARGFDMFRGQVRKGEFDRVLLRPRSTVLQVLGSDFEITRLGRLIVTLSVFFYAASQLDIVWNSLKIFAVVGMLVSGALIFTGIFILGATVCFWTIEGLEFINIFTDGGKELAAYPLTIYESWIRRLFTFIIPFGCFNYLPLMYLTGRSANPLYALSPILGCMFIVPCLIIWRIGVRHYVSTGN